MSNSENPHAGQGAVLLDIGGDIGALVVTMPATMDGIEVEIRPTGSSDSTPHVHRGEEHTHDHHHLPHVAVVARPVGGQTVHSLVFAELLAGDYELYERPHGPVQLTATVTGGQVCQLSWPSTSAFGE